mmetsp:Transcript_88133/g.139289  ORF Transcript_88133/g.139289 Transcript_88133/m.139289 type:complete len:551 (+) Transcript_88133:50-1702(+)
MMTSGPQQDGGAICAKQLIRTLTALPFYNEMPPCPACGQEAPPMALIGGSLLNECSTCGKSVYGSDTTETWAMLGHACGVCMAVLCVACNQEAEVKRRADDHESGFQEKINSEQQLLEARLTAANHELSMASAELAAEAALLSQGRTKAVAQAASLKADVARLRATSTKERAQLGKSFAELRSELNQRQAEMTEAQTNVCKCTAEFADLELAEANAEARIARRVARGEVFDAVDVKSNLLEQRSRLANEAEVHLSHQALRRQEEDAARKAVVQLRGDLIEARTNEVYYTTKDRCAIADAKAELDCICNPILAEPQRPQLPTRSEQVQATEPSPAPRGFRKFWGQVKEKAKEVKSIAKGVGKEVTQTIDEAAMALGNKEVARTQAQSTNSSSTSSRQHVAPNSFRPVSDDVIQLRAELSRSLSAWQEKTAQQMMHLNEAHEQLGQISAEATSMQSEVGTLRSEHQKESARRGQLRAELAALRRDAKSKNIALYAQLNDAFNIFFERSRAVVWALPRGLQDEQALVASKAHLISISSAMLDDCDSAIGWRCA